jgi:hypothetical protein
MVISIIKTMCLYQYIDPVFHFYHLSFFDIKDIIKQKVRTPKTQFILFLLSLSHIYKSKTDSFILSTNSTKSISTS